MAITKRELVREYSRAIQEGNAAVFGGAGLSRTSGYVEHQVMWIGRHFLDH